VHVVLLELALHGRRDVLVVVAVVVRAICVCIRICVGEEVL
jgi:hypothetical protein